MQFDLKGSTKGRLAKYNEDHFWRTKKHHKSVLKDLNFLEVSKELNDRLICFDRNDSFYLQKILKSDCEFLCNHNLMDYSLLLTIEQNCHKKKTTFMKSVLGSSEIESQKSRNKFNSSAQGQAVYHLGIIDYLQVWNRNK